MGVVLAYIGKLYTVEATAREAGVAGDALRLLRQLEAVPVLAELHAYLLKIREEVLPKSEAGQAVSYALKNWQALTRYCEDGALPIDNNRTERSLRGIAVGRRNWLFVGSKQAGPKVAAILSVIESCRRLGVPVREYLLEVLPGLDRKKMSQIATLTPAQWLARR